MIIDKPASTAPLRRLWKQAFGDTDAFLDSFFTLGYAPERCRQISIDGKVVAALYWFDCEFSGKKIAYLYAIATDKAHRGKGLCRLLMEDTHRHLKALGYAGALLVPANPELFDFYKIMGYRTCCSVNEFTCKADGAASLKFIEMDDYFHRRKSYLPAGSVAPAVPMLTFLHEQYFYYTGEDFLLSATAEGDTLIVTEFLGDPAFAPGIVAALGKKQGRFRTPGTEKPFAMYYSLDRTLEKPAYFPFALD